MSELGPDKESYRILFVDDETEFLDTIQEFFSGMGYTVFTASNGQAALLRVKEHEPSAVFLDISMPHMDGNEALRLIHKINPEIQVVVVSGFASEKLARDLLRDGACEFFQKPVDLIQLHNAVERLRTLKNLS